MVVWRLRVASESHDVTVSLRQLELQLEVGFNHDSVFEALPVRQYY